VREAGIALGLLIVCYLFLGGAGAGVFAVSAAVDLFWHRRRHPDPDMRSRPDGLFYGITGPGFVLSLVALVVGTVCLLADLERPDLAHLVFLHPTFTVVSIGAYSLALLTACAGFLALNWGLDLPQIPRAFVRAAEAAGLVLAIAVMVYTGLLLQSLKAVDFWETPLVTALFVLSSLATGGALLVGATLFLDMGHSLYRTLGKLSRLGMVVTFIEAACAVALLLGAAVGEDTSASAQALLTGEYAVPFWIGFVLCGLVLPPLMELLVLGHGHPAIAAGLAGSVLVGGFYLRFCIVGAGIQPGSTLAHVFGT